MKIPKKIQIAGRTVDIIVDHKDCQNERRYGSCHADRGKIILDDQKLSGYSEEEIKQTLVHEIMHFCNAILGKTGTECDKEEYVSPFSELLFQVIPQLEDNGEKTAEVNLSGFTLGGSFDPVEEIIKKKENT